MSSPSTSESASPGSGLPPIRGIDGRPVRALVVDDETTLAELVSMALRYEGWEIRTAAGGAAAVQAAREFRPDVIVLDVMLPDLDGMEVLRRIRPDGDFAPLCS
jgi:two-component system OmpR family response regulator